MTISVGALRALATASTMFVRPASAALEVYVLLLIFLAVAPVVLIMMLCCSRRGCDASRQSDHL